MFEINGIVYASEFKNCLLYTSIRNSRNEEPYTLTVNKDLTISSLSNLSEFEVLLLRLSRAGTAIIICLLYTS